MAITLPPEYLTVNSIDLVYWIDLIEIASLADGGGERGSDTTVAGAQGKIANPRFIDDRTVPLLGFLYGTRDRSGGVVSGAAAQRLQMYDHVRYLLANVCCPNGSTATRAAVVTLSDGHTYSGPIRVGRNIALSPFDPGDGRAKVGLSVTIPAGELVYA
jgi:hypothetical protein